MPGSSSSDSTTQAGAGGSSDSSAEDLLNSGGFEDPSGSGTPGAEGAGGAVGGGATEDLAATAAASGESALSAASKTGGKSAGGLAQDDPSETQEPEIQAQAFDLDAFQKSYGVIPPASIDLLRDVELNVKIELGRSRMLVQDVLRLAEGSVVELDKLAGDPVDVYVNDKLVARGEVLVLNDNFCVRVNEIVTLAREEVA
jgi:flagellar motor switch protein FliN/FliY